MMYMKNTMNIDINVVFKNTGCDYYRSLNS